jgi:hypothetical protein
MREIIKRWIDSIKNETEDSDIFHEQVEEALTCDRCSNLRITQEEATALDEAWGRTTHPCYTIPCACKSESKPYCQRCSSDRILEVYDTSKGGSDRIFHHMQLARRESYAEKVNIPGLDDGDGVMGLLICMQCGQVQGTFPVADPDVSEKWYDSEVLVRSVASYNALDF